MTEIKKCEDCKFVEPAKNKIVAIDTWDFARCTHPKSKRRKDAKFHLGVEAGEEPLYCETARSYERNCGKEAKYFEPK